MDNQNYQKNKSTRADRSESTGSGSVGWRDIFGAGGVESGSDDIAAEYRKLGESEAKRALQERTKTHDALQRAIELFGGLSGPSDDTIRTYVTELPQWFQQPERTETRIGIGDEVFETEGFCQTGDPLAGEGHTRTGTRVSMTVVCTDQQSGTGQPTWLATERELVGTLVSLLTTEVDRWEIGSLKRVSDGIATLDEDLCYTYVDHQAEQVLGTDSDDLCGECVWNVFPEAAGKVAEDAIQTALETRSPTSFERYNAEQEQWFEARVYPSDTGIIIVFSDITESKVTERQSEHVLETVPVGLVLLNDEGEITRANARAEELLGLSRSSMEGLGYDDPDWDIWDEAGDPITNEDHPVTRALTTGETVRGFTHEITLPDGTERWLSSNVAPIKRADGPIEQVVVVLDDITDTKRVERLTETFQLVNETLNSATRRQETEHIICELLTEAREYQYARLSEHIPGTELTHALLHDEPEAVSAEEWIDLPVQSQMEVEPVRAAIKTGQIQAVTIEQTNTRFASWRQHVLDQGFRAGAVVPLTHRGRIFDVLVLYTDRPEAFGDNEQALLTTLGDRAGQVFDALETERVLYADEVVELTFQSTDRESVFVSASEKLGCTIDIMDAVPTSDEMVVYYASVRDTSLAALDEFIKKADSAAGLRQIRHAENPPGGDVEIKLYQQSLAHKLITTGAAVKSDTVTDGQAEIVCEVPLGRDIDSLVNRLTASFSDTTLIKKTEYERSGESNVESVDQTLRDTFQDELTDRQQQVLRAAMYGGYFESPRGSTATEIADALSITQSTFAYHLRNAQQTLFDRLHRKR